MPTTSAILKSIQHPARREILKMLRENHAPVSYTTLLPLCDNSTGKLNYHLRTLDEIVMKGDTGYVLTTIGEKILTWLENIVSMSDKPDKDKPVVVFSRIFPDTSYRNKYLLILLLSSLVLSMMSLVLFFVLQIIYHFLVIFFSTLVVGGLFQLYYQSIWYQITDTEVIVHKGIMTKTLKIVPFLTITNIELKQGLFDRMFKIATLDIQTAGISRSGVEEKLVGLVDAEDIKNTVIERIRLLNPLNMPSVHSSSILADDQGRLIKIRDALQSLNQELKEENE
ncbi:MAG: PH domain-containing protein [Candidatus Kariarchaeaceae archaeon]|jgi:membrane protein YdbS with pleckstrin-like domain